MKYSDVFMIILRNIDLGLYIADEGSEQFMTVGVPALKIPTFVPLSTETNLVYIFVEYNTHKDDLTDSTLTISVYRTTRQMALIIVLAEFRVYPKILFK